MTTQLTRLRQALRDHNIRTSQPTRDGVFPLLHRVNGHRISIWIQQIRSNLYRVTVYVGGFEAASTTFMPKLGDIINDQLGVTACNELVSGIIARFGDIVSEDDFE